LNRIPRHLSLHELSPTVELVTYHWFRKSIWFHYRVPNHHFILVESGRILAVTPEGRFTAEPGDLICFRPTDWNQYGAESGTRYYETHVQFAPPPRHGLTPYFDETGPLPVQLAMAEAYNEARRLFETLCLEIGNGDTTSRLKTRAAIFELLALITRSSDAGKHSLCPLPDFWQRVERELRDTLHQDLNVARFAARLGLGPEHFIRQFKHRFGRTPKAYHTQVRLREAVRILRSSERSVKDVAYSLGFSDPKGFSRIFKQHLGVRPSDIRNVEPPLERLPSHLPRPFPVNRHLLPPGTQPDWFKSYLPLGRAPALREQTEETLIKISHPEELPQTG